MSISRGTAGFNGRICLYKSMDVPGLIVLIG